MPLFPNRYFPRRLVCGAATSLLAVLLLSGCGGGGGSRVDSSPATYASASSTFQSVRFTLTADNKQSSDNRAVYNRGETASLVFTITNESATDVAFVGGQFPAQFVVMRNGSEVWRVQYTSQDVATGDNDTIDTAVIPRVVHPGDTLDYHIRWPLVDQSGNRITPGDYEAVAWFQTTSGVNSHLGGQYQSVDARQDLASGRLPIAVQ